MAKSETKSEQGQANQQSTNQSQGAAQSGAMQSAGEQGRERGLTRRGANSPTLFLLSPREILTASPFELMRRFSEQMGRVFEDYGLSAAPAGTTSSASQMATWSPAIEVFQQGDNLIVRAELPGLNKEDVKVEMTDDGLVIQGERKQEHEEKGAGFYRSERSYGRFYRLIPLPDGVDTEQVNAQFNNGVLEVTVPIPQAQQRRREVPIGATGGGQQQQSRAASAKPTQS
jgi:HSP20 family protein